MTQAKDVETVPTTASPTTVSPSAQAENTRPIYLSLDAWRGLAALMVVLRHSSAAILWKEWPHLRDVAPYSAFKWGGVGVQLFFVISGYCIAAAATSRWNMAGGEKAFALARVRRIFPPYWWTLLVAILPISAMQLLQARGLPHTGLLASSPLWGEPPIFYIATLTLTQKILLPLSSFPQPFVLSVFWTLTYELAFYAIVWLGLLIARRARRSPHLLLNSLHALTALTLLWNALAPDGRALPYPLDLWAQFGLGVLVFDALQGHRLGARFKYAPLLWMGVFTVLIAARIALHGWTTTPNSVFTRELGIGTPQDVFHFTMCWSFALLLWLLHPYDGRLMETRVVRALAWVGLFSYSLYLTHLLIVPIVRQVMLKALPHPSLFWIVILAQVLAALVLGRLFFQFAEKPYLRAATPKGSREPRVFTPEAMGAEKVGVAP